MDPKWGHLAIGRGVSQNFEYTGGTQTVGLGHVFSVDLRWSAGQRARQRPLKLVDGSGDYSLSSHRGVGGAVSSALGQLLSWLLDDPKIHWNVKSVFLFALFFSLAFSVLFGLLAVDLEREAIARGEIYNRVTFGVSLISGFLTPLLGGLLNNLRDDSNHA